MRLTFNMRLRAYANYMPVRPRALDACAPMRLNPYQLAHYMPLACLVFVATIER